MKLIKKLFLSLLAVSMLAGCGGNGKADGEITINLGSEPPEMLTFLTTDTTSGNVLRHVIETLIRLDENNKAAPGVAKEVPTKENGGVSEDGKTIVFNLNPDAKWHNGDPVTAQDFEFAWDQLFKLSNGGNYASTWAPLIKGASEVLACQDDASYEKALENKGWKASEDGLTFTVELTGPYVYFVNLMAFYSFAPVQEKAYVAGGGLDKYGNDVEGYLMNGPFVIESWEHESNLVLVKNENYWNKDAVKLNKITMEMISDSNTAMNVFDDGTCDMIGISGDYVQTYKDNGVDVKEYGDGSTWYFEFNTAQPGLNNAKVRKALTYAYDVPQFVEKLIKNSSADAKTFTPKAINGGDFSKAMGDLYNRTYDDKQWADAKALLEEGLKEEGIKVEDFSLTILGDVSDTAKKNYEYFQAQWQEHLGIKVEIQQVEFQDRLNKMDQKDFGVVFAGWGPDYDDPMTFLDLWVTDGGNNHTSWSNAEYDECVAKALVEADATKRMEYLKRCEEIIATEFPVGVIYERNRSYLTSERLHGVIRNAFSDIDLTKAYTK